MTFYHPSMLWLLALPVIWGFWQWTRRGHPLVMPFDYGHQREGRRLSAVVNLANALPALLLAGAILVLAGPRRTAPPEHQRILNNIIICLDISGSMSSPFSGKMTRLDAAMEAAREFCEYRKGDAFGLTIFGSEFLHWFPPTKETSAITMALPFVRSEYLPPWFGGTLIGLALRGCRDRLIRIKEGDRAVILISDGGSADFGQGRDRQVGEELAEAKIRVYTVLIGRDFYGMGVDGVYTISGMTGGKVFQAGDPATLETVFREIDQMQKATFKQVTSDWVDYYTPLSRAGLIVAGLYVFSLLGLRYTPW